MISYHLTAAVLGIAVALVILHLVRRDHLRIRYAYWWLMVAGFSLLLGIYPQLVDVIAPLLGVSYPPVLALVLGLIAIILKMLMMDLEHTRQEREVRRLTQRLALFEAEQGQINDER